MKIPTKSLYLSLSLIIISTVIVIMSINSAYTYVQTKNKTIESMKKSSQTTVLSLKNNVASFISAYAVNEYDKVVGNEIIRRDIFAIVINDFNMGKILGTSSYISGKLKSNNNIIDYNPTNGKHNKQLEECFYSNTYDIIAENGQHVGNISIYISDDTMQKKLEEIIVENIKNSLFISLLLIISLVTTIRVFILKPISDIAKTISKSDKDGIPLRKIIYNGFTEINVLANSMNKMIYSIKRSRRVLRSDQNRLQYLLELSPIAVRVAQDEGKNVIFANQAYAKLLKIDKEEFIHKNPKDYYAHKEVYDDIIQRLSEDKTIDNQLVELKIKGNVIWVLASYMHIMFDGKQSIIGWFYDVTKEKNNETRLYQALELQTTVFDNSGYLIVRTDPSGIIKQVNKEALKLLEYEAEELIDIHTPEVIHLKHEVSKRAQDFSQELKETIEPGFEVFIRKCNLGLPNEHEWTYVSKSGKQIPVLLAVTSLKNENNEIYGYLGMAKDITETKLIESQSKLASMGEMIGNIAHQWRQPLSAISTIASGVRVKSEFEQLNTSELLEDMDNITNQAQYLSKTIDDFRDFIKDTNKKEHISICKTVEKALNIVNSSLKNHNITVILDLKEDLELNGFGNELIQAIINIINNAKDAIKESEHNDSERFIFIDTQKEKENLILTITDNGGGIKESIINNIFNPYFTTKHQSVGTGIGLSMAYQIITEHHNATISVSNETTLHENKEYLGASFQIVFKK